MSAKEEYHRGGPAFAATSPNNNMVRIAQPTDVFSPPHYHQHPQAAPPNLSATHVPDNREWCTPSYRPVRGGHAAAESGRFYPYPSQSRPQSSSPPYGVRSHSAHHQQQMHPARSTYSSEFSSYSGATANGGLASMPELTSSSAVNPDTVASSGPLPFDKEQLLAQSSSRSSYLTPPNSAPPCNGSADEHTPTSSRSTLLPTSTVDPTATAHHQLYRGGYTSSQPHFAPDVNSDNDSGNGDSPYTTSLQRPQPPPDHPESPENSTSTDGDFEPSDIGVSEFATGNGKKLRNADEFARVPGRLSLLGAASKYVVTVGEIKRRLSPPECLNASLLGGVLRKAKAKNGGSDLRKALDDIGVALPPGRRKATSTSMLTSLVEEEAKALAHQFNEVCATMFPVAEMANTVAQHHEFHQQNSLFREHRQHDIHAALNLTNELRHVIDMYIAQEEDKQNQDKDGIPMTGLRQFSLITHSFGVPTISGVLTLFQSYLTALLKCTGGMPIRDDHALHRGQMR